MRRTLLISVAALALAAASNMTFAQTGKPSGGAAGGGTSAPAASPSGAAPAGGGSSSTVNPTGDSQSTINETTPPGAHKGAQDTHKGAQKGAQDMHKGAPDTQKGAQDTTGPQKQKSSEQTPGDKSRTQQSQGEQPRGERREQSQTEPRGERSKQQSQGERSREQMNQQQSQSPQTGTSKQGAADRPMTSKSVSLTTQQKTTIREKVLTSSAPRVERVDFDVKVGTVVPRTVRIAPLPATIVEIEPEWRGYMYFVRGDEIIVVEPGTLRIVAVLDV
jgi:hypothetical protein